MALKRDIRVKKIISPGFIYFYLSTIAICLNFCKEKLLGAIFLHLPICGWNI